MEKSTQNFSSEIPSESRNITPDSLRLYRRRLIPEECIPLTDDIILYYCDGILVTSWKTLHPKKDMDHGYSCYFLYEGYKISRFCRADDTLLYNYCDIISPAYDSGTNTLIVTDLLADVLIYPDGFIKTVDLAELADAHESGLLSDAQLRLSLRTLDKLLGLLYAGKLSALLAPIDACVSHI